MFITLLGDLRYNKSSVKHETAQVLAYLSPPLTIAKGEFRMATSDYTPEDIQKFWANIERRSVADCWEWQGKLTRGTWGYGYLYLAGKRYIASRLAYELTNGKIPDGLKVLHKCDNPPCCNPAHLFVGTQADNVHDMIAKGRKVVVTGEENGQHKLTTSQVLEIRRALNRGVRKNRLAARFAVSEKTIRLIEQNEMWKDAQP